MTSLQSAHALEATIASACDAARNPHASSHMNAAVARLIDFLIRNKPPAFPIAFTPPECLEEADEYLKSLARLSGEIVENIASEADVSGSFDSIFTDALHDNGPELHAHADRIREDMEERVLEAVR